MIGTPVIGPRRPTRARPWPARFRASLLTALVLSLGATTPLKAADCRQALALALDVSGSVDSREYMIQRRGLAAALLHPQVQEALLAPGPPVELMVFEWSGPGAQHTVLPWRAITSLTELRAVAARIDSAPRAALPPPTALGSAMQHGIAALGTRNCASLTLDISGDGKSNAGPRPAPLRRIAERADITINALVIGVQDSAAESQRIVTTAELVAYFKANVIAGPGAFTETALGFEEYEAAMVRKLLRELATLQLSQRGSGTAFQ
ncbi:DUF1194 domain-containing protein [Rhodalgimonas zhirmunskyi]|uniref:DUF1194 domain-containing protein n=1 Tax=Rhodalgimonas zhirmunskyi TaxID=2964767 RepID=A0AAJ1X6G6_9RHOB|nr:DUF1194 domain-containing protein [Rhodoalgimonas zhirmunskyi]MDQ2093427.1 DUF1194 domain-containing protein [Rhodoalgimonas zhirmunskyi]